MKSASRPHATIHDVASRAGASIKTVSRVMNDEPGVRPAMRERVLAAMAALAYRPNPGARRMSNARSYVIGLFYRVRMGGYIDRLQIGASRCCRRSRYMLAIEPLEWDEPALAASIENTILDLHLDGVILAPPICDDMAVIAMLERLAVPFVRVSPRVEEDRASSVAVDDRAAQARITEYVLSLGHREVAFVGGPPHLGASTPRLAGFHDALAAAGIDADAGRIVDGGGTIEGGRRAAAVLLNSANPPTAIVTAGDVMAFGAMFEAARRGVSLPGDLSITGFDDVAQAAALEPALTTVRQPVEQMGEAAASIVIAACGRRADGAPVHHMLETTPVIRDSCAPPPQGDTR